MGKIKFTVFSDLHHHPQWFKTEAPERLRAIQQRALQDNSELMLHLGDFCHKTSISHEIIKQYRDFSIPSYFVMGNHEFDLASYEEVLQDYGLECGYYFFDHNGFRFVMLDENYFCDFPGIYFHYSERNYFDHPAGRDWIDQKQLEWFKETVFSSPHPCIVCSHAALKYPSSTKNNEAISQIIRDSQKLPGKIMLCLNGHYHQDTFNICENVAYFGVNSASFFWVPNPHYLYPPELYCEFESIGNQIIYTNPLSATVTLDHDGTIEICGTPGEYWLGVDVEMSKNNNPRSACSASILDRKAKLDV